MQGDEGVEVGSPIIAKKPLSSDSEYFGLVDKYKSAEIPERHRLIKQVRRAQLRMSSAQSGENDARGRLRPEKPHDSGTEIAADSDTDSDSDLDLTLNYEDADDHKRKLEKQRALWESTLPEATTQLELQPAAKSDYTFIEADETPTKTYEQKFLERKRRKASRRPRIPFR